jgi:hypothetical protein
MIFWNQAKDDGLIYVAFYKTKLYQHLIHKPFKTLQRCFSNQMAKIAIDTNNPSHEDLSPKM